MGCAIYRYLSVLFGGHVCDLRSTFLQVALFNDNFLIMRESVETVDLSAILNIAVGSNSNSVSQAPPVRLDNLNRPLDGFLVHFIRPLVDILT